MIRRFSFLAVFFVLTLGVSSCGSDDEDDRSSGNNTPPRDNSNNYPIASPSVVYLWLPGSSSGDLGGIAGANATCREAGEEKTFEMEVSTHRAFLSSSKQDARGFFANDPPVKRSDGTQIIGSYADYFDPGEELDAKVENTTAVFWTGTSPDGTPSNENCNDWTSNDAAVRGADGSAQAINRSRLNYGGDVCDSILTIICISY